MYDKSKHLSKNKLNKVNYFGKDTAILKNVIFFNSLEIINNKIVCKELDFTKNLDNTYKLINTLKFITALSKSSKTIYEKCIVLFQTVGFPRSHFPGLKNNTFVIENDFIEEIEQKLNIFKNIDENKIKDINKISNDFPISFILKSNPSRLTSYTMIPTSEGIFNIAWYCYTLLSSSSKFNEIFICSECGNIYHSNSNKQRYCQKCSSQIDFSEISKLKSLKKL